MSHSITLLFCPLHYMTIRRKNQPKSSKNL
nr:MAG TPA: hypothetical protein [Caudoviricetes sp.]DAT67426.1 MAG TPA: hypothetical protein [Caudoviricetes sp.]